MATKTSTSTNTSITQKGDLYIVKEVVTKTTTSPGKEPIVEVTESVNEYQGKDKLPEPIRKQLEKKAIDQPLNMNATRGDFAEDVLKEINKYRKLHGSNPLNLSSKLLKHCAERAKKMSEVDDMLDTDDDQYGESVTCMSSNDPQFYVKAESVVSRWYSGCESYDYTREPEELSAGHFTQMIWKSTKEMGIAAAKSKTNQIYVVACFEPRGNYTSKFIENVSPPVSKAKSCLSMISSKLSSKKSPNTNVPPASNNVSQLNVNCVDCHNKFRQRHGLPPLTYSKELAEYAQEWADYLAKTDRFDHRPDGKYGENLYYSYNSAPEKIPQASEACESWYEEIKQYKFGLETAQPGTGHFTQMIWRDTKEVGMGRARSKSGKYYIVANYSPPGNYIGRFTKNVPKPLH